MIWPNERDLQDHFEDRLQADVQLAIHTTSKVGGTARYFLVSRSADELASDVEFLWAHEIPMFILGSGSNILISDSGVDAVVIHNMAKSIRIDSTPSLTVESGAIFATVSRHAALHNLSGLEWACTIPGTIGGAVYGNAGAHGADMSKNLILAKILHRIKGHLSLNAEQMEYTYRSSMLKRDPGNAVILSVELAVTNGDAGHIKEKMEEFAGRRRSTQPQGASTGSTFKNPPGHYVGELIESAGLKGISIGGVQVSPVHANFLVNNGHGTAQDYRRLIHLVQTTVLEKTGINLELEVEFVGKW